MNLDLSGIMPDGAGTIWLPTDPPRPCPPLLTADEAICFLRINRSGNRNPRRTLEYYREQGLLTGIKMGRTIVYPLANVFAFAQKKLRDQPR